MVRVKGLEPPRIAAPDPKSGVSTNSTTLACRKQFMTHVKPCPVVSNSER